MPGLFGIPTPEEIRAQIGKTGSERDLSLASLPAGRGPTAFASSLGRLAGRAAFGPSQEEEEAQKKQLVSQRVQAEASKQGISAETDPVAFSSLAAKMFIGEGMQEAAANALKFGNEFDRLINLPETALTTEIKAAFGIPKSGKISDNKEAAAHLKRVQLARATTQRSDEGAVASASGTERAVADTFLFDKFKEGVSFTFPSRVSGDPTTEKFTNDDFESPENFQTLADFVADTAKEFQAKEKEKQGGKVLNAAVARRKAFALAKPFINVTGAIDKDLVFDVSGAAASLEEQLGGAQTIDFNAVK